MTSVKPKLNNLLCWLHRGLFFWYALMAVLLLMTMVYLMVFSAYPLDFNSPDAAYEIRQFLIYLCLPVAFGVMHLFAAIGVRAGKAWGRVMSIILGLLLSAGFVTTPLGIYMLLLAGWRWQRATAGEEAGST